MAAESKSKAEVGKPAPAFALKDLYGKEFSLSEFKGKTVVLEWFNVGCPVVKKAHRAHVMQDTYKKAVDKGVVWLAIDTTAGAQAEANRVHAVQNGLAYPILLDKDGEVGRAYGAKTTPHMFVINKDGVLVYNGAIDDKGEKNYVANALEALGAGKDVSPANTEPYGCGVKYPSRGGV
jgi:peroxiredoxin